jgi:AcrR family transcriptional regulator
MARSVRPEQYAAKRAEILNAAQRLLFSQGYERMSIQDILEEVRISSGAFHHYFASRGALLEAFIEQVKEESGKPLRQLIDDPKLSAREKFQGFFIEEIVTTHAVYMDAIERVLGVPSHTFYRTNAEGVQLWVEAIREDDQQ